VKTSQHLSLKFKFAVFVILVFYIYTSEMNLTNRLTGKDKWEVNMFGFAFINVRLNSMHFDPAIMIYIREKNSLRCWS
jgi:hypothetical protein